MDEDFIHKIEASLPENSAIYQLPYVPFPESGPVNDLSVYQLGTGFISSKTLRWSFGGMKGREGDLFYRALSKETVAKQLDVIKRLGFAGIYIDRRGFADRGESVVMELTSLLGTGPALERADGNVVFFKVPVRTDISIENLDSKQIMERAGFHPD
jgi:phosphoglycerol transferase